MTTTVPMGVTAASIMTLGPEQALAAARLADDLGYQSFWTAETTGPRRSPARGGRRPPPRSTSAPVSWRLQLRTPAAGGHGRGHPAGPAPRRRHPPRRRHLVAGRGTERWHGAPYGDRPARPGP